VRNDQNKALDNAEMAFGALCLRHSFNGVAQGGGFFARRRMNKDIEALQRLGERQSMAASQIDQMIAILGKDPYKGEGDDPDIEKIITQFFDYMAALDQSNEESKTRQIAALEHKP
jgi:hypothetical protein